MRTFDLDAFDAFDGDDRPGAQILPWEMWERERPWRHDAGPEAGHDPAGRPGPEAATSDTRPPPGRHTGTGDARFG
jgi:hypothetical protein